MAEQQRRFADGKRAILAEKAQEVWYRPMIDFTTVALVKFIASRVLQATFAIDARLGRKFCSLWGIPSFKPS